MTQGSVDDLIAVARNEVGYVEGGGPDGRSGNITKYWAELHPSFQGQPWCAGFVSWCFLHSNNPLPFMGTNYGFAYVPSARAHYENIGAFYDSPLPGDFFIYAGEAHTGIVTTWADGNGDFRTIEGNTSPGSSGSQTNGGGVYARTRNLNDVIGFCRPTFGTTAPPPDKENDENMTIIAWVPAGPTSGPGFYELQPTCRYYIGGPEVVDGLKNLGAKVVGEPQEWAKTIPVRVEGALEDIVAALAAAVQNTAVALAALNANVKEQSALLRLVSASIHGLA